MMEQDSFFKLWKETSFGWIPKKYYKQFSFDLKIIAMLAAYGFAIMFQAEDRILTAIVKLVAYSLLYRLFKKWFSERTTLKNVLKDKQPSAVLRQSRMESQKNIPEINPLKETLLPLQNWWRRS